MSIASGKCSLLVSSSSSPLSHFSSMAPPSSFPSNTQPHTKSAPNDAHTVFDGRIGTKANNINTAQNGSDFPSYLKLLDQATQSASASTALLSAPILVDGVVSGAIIATNKLPHAEGADADAVDQLSSAAAAKSTHPSDTDRGGVGGGNPRDAPAASSSSSREGFTPGDEALMGFLVAAAGLGIKIGRGAAGRTEPATAVRQLTACIPDALRSQSQGEGDAGRGGSRDCADATHASLVRCRLVVVFFAISNSQPH
jgi:hypothetical protein